MGSKYAMFFVAAIKGMTNFSIPSKAFLELVDRAGFKIPPNELSKTMFELGMKREATTRVSYCGKQLRSWCFIPEIVLREKGE